MAAHVSVHDAKNVSDFDQIMTSAGGCLVVVHFWADWAPQCAQMNEVMVELAKDSKNVNVCFVKLEAEAVPEVSEKYEIAAVPTFIFIQNKKQIDRLDGANVPELTKRVNKHNSASVGSLPAAPAKEDLNTRLGKLISSAPVMLFMKGDREQPRCGFSKQIVQILNDQNVDYSTFDILTDDEVRQGLKSYSDWPTYPQLYSNGELLGGLDIVREMVESGELEEMLPKNQNLEDRLKALINKDKVVLFMKGRPEEPRCGFSKTIVGLLNEEGVKYSTFDILTDDEVRQGLKKYSDWPTYPQLYVSGELIGGLDIVRELKESGELKSTLVGE